ncbi:MAG: hypothetical protein IJS29_03910 [Selenomonadaceae bacterium]|nr:hypothetical protein [Selenomonadaceae bacterium]
MEDVHIKYLEIHAHILNWRKRILIPFLRGCSNLRTHYLKEFVSHTFGDNKTAHEEYAEVSLMLDDIEKGVVKLMNSLCAIHSKNYETFNAFENVEADLDGVEIFSPTNTAFSDFIDKVYRKFLKEFLEQNFDYLSTLTMHISSIFPSWALYNNEFEKIKLTVAEIEQDTLKLMEYLDDMYFQNVN